MLGMLVRGCCGKQAPGACGLRTTSSHLLSCVLNFPFDIKASGNDAGRLQRTPCGPALC